MCKCYLAEVVTDHWNSISDAGEFIQSVATIFAISFYYFSCREAGEKTSYKANNLDIFKPSIRNGNLKTRTKPTSHSAPACRQIISLRRLYKKSYRRLLKFRRTIIQSTMATDGKNGGKVVCVTGGGGYIGSWLVKNLLERGYTVHATLRDIGDEAKCRPLLDLKGTSERLKLFQADLLDEGSFDSAVEGCQGVFHVANPVPPGKESSLEDFVNTSVNGVLNVMKACTRAKSVKRMVLTSSLSAASPLNEKGELTSACLDESCWSNVDVLGSQTNKGAWYGAAKTLEEQEALKYGAQNNLEVVTLLPSLVIGPWFTKIPGYTSLQTVLSLIGENDLFYEELRSIQSVTGSIGTVHIDDICNAHIYLMEHPSAQDRYICSGDSAMLNILKQLLSKQLNVSIRLDAEDPVKRNVPISSKKLLDMGFCFKYTLEKALEESVQCALQNGFLKL